MSGFESWDVVVWEITKAAATRLPETSLDEIQEEAYEVALGSTTNLGEVKASHLARWTDYVEGYIGSKR